ncbi:hypothetical protein DDI_2372 [Dickeya dianthicola RNS04.9]|nr:hypothetical protein DDI_2372 [Dickeya dianthicola RNS04.9]
MCEPFTGMIPSLSMSELNHFRRAFYPPLPVNPNRAIA